MKLILDCSAALALTLPDEQGPEREALVSQMERAVIHAPAIWPFEVANSLWVAVRRGRLEVEALPDILKGIRNLGVRVAADVPDFERLYALAVSHEVAAYDAAYIGHALAENAGLLTFDKKLQAAARNAGIEVLPHQGTNE